MTPISNGDLQRIWEAALTEYKSRHNTDYEPKLFALLCYINAYCEWQGIGKPVELKRDACYTLPEEGD